MFGWSIFFRSLRFFWVGDGWHNLIQECFTCYDTPSSLPPRRHVTCHISNLSFCYFLSYLPIHLSSCTGGESRALNALSSFLQSRGKDYSFNISSPNKSWKSCSRLSKYCKTNLPLLLPLQPPQTDIIVCQAPLLHHLITYFFHLHQSVPILQSLSNTPFKALI